MVWVVMCLIFINRLIPCGLPQGYRIGLSPGFALGFNTFYCPKARLVVELDGDGHAEKYQIEYDKERSMYLLGNDIRVLRFWNSDVMRNIISVMEVIKSHTHITPPNLLLPQGEERI